MPQRRQNCGRPLGARAFFIGSEKLANAVYGSCEPISEKIRYIYEIRSALIQTWCFYSVKRPEIAENYLKFAEDRALSLGAVNAI